MRKSFFNWMGRWACERLSEKIISLAKKISLSEKNNFLGEKISLSEKSFPWQKIKKPLEKNKKSLIVYFKLISFFF